jgi:glycosyltransferase involved in cell wall biosynthesis
MAQKIKVCFVMAGRNGVDYHRLEIPFNKLNEKYSDLEITGVNGFTLDNPPTDFDVIVLNRCSRQAEPYIQMAKDSGVKIILDLDDWIEVPSYSNHHDGINTPIVENEIKWTLTMADEIWCASQFLADSILIEVPDLTPVRYVPNAIDFDQPQFQLQTRKQDKYTIGYVAGSTHHKDVELLYNPLMNLLTQKDYNLLVAGYAKQNDTYWNYITGIFTSGGNLDPRRYQKIEQMDVYNYALSYNLCDLVLAPLAKNLFNQCKSNLKVLEAGAFNLPIICSNIEPYKEFISQGLVYASEGNWDKRIKELIKSPAKGAKMGVKLGEYVREYYNIELINKKRYESITNIIN